MLTQVLTALLTASVVGLIKVIYDYSKALNALLKEHGERIAVLEIKVEDAEEDIRRIQHVRN